MKQDIMGHKPSCADDLDRKFVSETSLSLADERKLRMRLYQ